MTHAAHFNAILDLLAGNTNLAGKVSDTVRTDAEGVLIRETYLVVFGGPPDLLSSNRASAPQAADSDATYVYTIRAVSPTTSGVRDISSAAIAQLVGAIPAITGRNCAPIRLTHARDVQADNAVLPPLFFSDMEFTLLSLKG